MSAPKSNRDAEGLDVADRRTVSRNFSWMLFGNVVTAASNWLIIAVIARLATPHVVGEYAYALALCQPLIMLSQLNLRSLQATDTEDRNPFHDYFTLRLVCSAVCILTLGMLCLVLRPSAHTMAVIMIVGLSMSFDSISDVIYGYLQQQERMKVIGISNALKGSSALLALGVTLFVTRDLFWGVVASATASAAVLLLFDLGNVWLHREGQAPSRPTLIVVRSERVPVLLQLAKSAVPMGMVMMLCSLTTSTPRLAVGQFLGTYELGVFAAMMSIIGMGRIVVNALGQAATPRMARHLASGERQKFYSTFRALMLVGGVLSLAAPIGAYVIGEEVIVMIYGPAYGGTRSILTWCMFAGAISYLASLVGYAITAARVFVAQLHLLIAVCVVGVVSSWFLVPMAGLTGAAWSFAAAMAVQGVGSIVLLRGRLANR